MRLWEIYKRYVIFAAMKKTIAVKMEESLTNCEGVKLNHISMLHEVAKDGGTRVWIRPSS